MALVPVSTTLWDMEYSVHECPKRHKDEVQAVFPGVDIADMLVVPTCQRSVNDLVRTGEVIEQEKDALLERFMEFAKVVCDKLMEQGHWADYIDPCSGLPMLQRNGMKVYSEVDGLSSLLGYKTANAGCCKVVLHPTWGSSVYPASMFTKAPLEALQAAIALAEQQLRGATTAAA